MSEFKVGDKVKTTVKDYDFPVGSAGEVTQVWSSDAVNIRFGGSPKTWYYLSSGVEKVEDEQTIDLTDLDAEAVGKVKEFADSLRKQAPPTEENKYIWLTRGGGTEALAIRCSDGEYVWVPNGWDTGDYIASDQITNWRPAEVK